MDVVPLLADVDANGVVGFAMDAFGTRSGIRFARAAICRPQMVGVSFCGEPRCRAIREVASSVGWRLAERAPHGHPRDFALDTRPRSRAGPGGALRCSVAPGHEQLCELWKTFTG